MNVVIKQRIELLHYAIFRAEAVVHRCIAVRKCFTQNDRKKTILESIGLQSYLRRKSSLVLSGKF